MSKRRAVLPHTWRGIFQNFAKVPLFGDNGVKIFCESEMHIKQMQLFV